MNDERPIEKLLRRYAKKRRDEAGAPFELHPATRRMLQGEVSRQFPKAGVERRAPFAEWLGGFRRRWIYATAVAIALVAGVVLLAPNHAPSPAAKSGELSLSKNGIAPVTNLAMESREAEVAKQTTPLASVSATAPTLAFNSPSPTTVAPEANSVVQGGVSKSLAWNAPTERFRVLSEPTASASPVLPTRDLERKIVPVEATRKKAPQPVAPVEEYADAAKAAQLSARSLDATADTATLATASVAEGQAGEVSGPRRYDRIAEVSTGRPSKLEGSRTATVSAPKANTPALSSRYSSATTTLADGEREKSPAVSQSFANVLPSSLAGKATKASSRSPVLSNFQIEQSGESVRVIDSDGSSYLGGINAALDDSSQEQLRRKLQEKTPVTTAASASLSAQPAQGQSFRVEGTNRTLNQKVVFTWNFVPLTNAPDPSKAKAANEFLNQDRLAVQQQFPQLLQNSAISGRAQINAGKEIEINAMPLTPTLKAMTPAQK